MRLIYRCLCMVFGAILGSGCSDSVDPDPEYGPAAEYGMPHATVRLDGRVVDHRGQPIPGVAVSFEGAGADTTDALGAWTIETGQALVPCIIGGTDCSILATDIDGPANGGPYPPAQQPLDLEQTEPGDGRWYYGTWEQHGLDITMTDAVEYGPPCAEARQPEPPGAADE